MEKELLAFNPDTGIATYTEIVDEGNVQKILVTQEQDVSNLIDHCTKLRNENIHQAKDEYFHYAKVPAIVQLQLLKKGIDFFSQDPAVQRRVRQEIETNYPYLKTSYAKHV